MSTSLPVTGDQQDTIKIYGAFSQVTTDLQAARNDLAVAMRNYAMNETPENKLAMQDAQAKVHGLEQEYRDAHRLLQEYVCSKQKAKRS